MICAEATPSGPVTVAPVQPADMATCAVVLITGSELGAIAGIAPPTPAEFAGAWSLGFSLVLMSYLLAWPVGAVLRLVGWNPRR